MHFVNGTCVVLCKLYKRELHDRVGYYDEQIKPQDHDMFLRFAMNGAKFVHIPKVLANCAHSRWRSGSCQPFSRQLEQAI